MILGHQLGSHHVARTSDTAVTGLGNVEAAILTLVGLLLAFTISGALQRFDERRQLMLKEAHATVTAYDRFGLLDNGARRDLRQRVKDHLGARIDLYREARDPKNMHVRKQRDKSKHGHDLELQFF